MHRHNLTTPPRALLLDFGGVIFQTSKRPTGRDEFTHLLFERLARLGMFVEHSVIRRSLDAGLSGLKHWKHSSSRRRTPREMTHREVVGDFLASDLPEQARAILVAEASEVLAEMHTTLSDHDLRPGIREIIAYCVENGIALGIVSNAHSGRNHRAILETHGLYEPFGVQVYSDEVGIRKPHPGMIEVAAQALGFTPAECWYVGDTQDRDVVAGRRAGVGAVILTASQHTTTPPFAVAEQADAVYPTPEGLLEALQAANASALSRSPLPAATAAATAAAATEANASVTSPRDATGSSPIDAINAESYAPALLIDHGGVIATSAYDEQAMTDFVEFLARLLDTPAEPFSAERVRELIRAARQRHKEHKVHLREHRDTTQLPYQELSALEFWRGMFGQDLPERAQTLLAAESENLMYRFGLAKSRRTLRPGISELFEYCTLTGIRIVVVSNTISGRSVRESCARLGVDQYIGAYVCSNEQGFRKPDPSIFHEALKVAGVHAAHAWFLGDKPENDAAGARAVGIPHRIIIAGGTTGTSDINVAVSSGLATAAVDNAYELIDLMRAHLSPAHQQLPSSIGV